MSSKVSLILMKKKELHQKILLNWFNNILGPVGASLKTLQVEFFFVLT